MRDIISILAGLGNQEALLKRVSDSPTMERSGQSPKILVAESPDHEGKQGTGGCCCRCFFRSVLFCLSDVLSPWHDSSRSHEGVLEVLAEDPCRCELWLVYGCPNLVNVCRVWQVQSMGEKV